MNPLETSAAKVDGKDVQSALTPIHRCLKQFAPYRIWPSLLPQPESSIAGLGDEVIILAADHFLSAALAIAMFPHLGRWLNPNSLQCLMKTIRPNAILFGLTLAGPSLPHMRAAP